jgi:acetyltransferase-like isoleucine patch superfamily enzyme
VFSRTDIPIKDQGTTEAGITIGNDVWLGAKVTILDGTVIGDGCIVAAGAVVKGEFPPRSIIAGVPARVVKTREETLAP